VLCNFCFTYLSCNVWPKMNRNKFYCIRGGALLMQPSTSGQGDWQRTCMQMDNILNTYCELLVRPQKNYGQIKCKQLRFMFFYCCFSDFHIAKLSQCKVCTLNRLGGKINHILMASSLSNNCSKNYWNGTTTVKIIVGRWIYLVYFLRHSVEAAL